RDTLTKATDRTNRKVSDERRALVCVLINADIGRMSALGANRTRRDDGNDVNDPSGHRPPFLRNLFKFVLFGRVRHLRRAQRGLVSKPSVKIRPGQHRKPLFSSSPDASWSLCNCPRTCSSASNICSLTPIAPAAVPEPLTTYDPWF